MSRPRLVPLGIAAVVMSLALAGCSAGADKNSGSGSELSYEDSPLNEYLAAVYDAQDDVDFDEQQMKTEELIAVCMAEEGFEYIPVDYSSQFEEMDEQDIEDQNTEEWVTENGYGINQTSEQMDESTDQATEFVDPNQDYVATLSESEQMAFYEVLYGPSPDESELDEDGSYEYNWEEAGCSGSAQHETGGQNMWEDEAHKNVTDAMADLYTTLDASPEMAKLNSEWASCMADAGHAEFTAKSEAIQAVMDEQNALWEGTDTGPTEEQTAAAREKELEIALADFRCAEEIDYMTKSLEAQFALEEQFISDYKAELDALIADYENGA